MSDSTDTGLAARFAALHVERERSWPRERLQANVAQRRRLVETFDPACMVKVGDRITPFALETAGGWPLPSDELLADGAAALIFFRFAGCPACNIALPHYDRRLVPALADAGIGTIAVSPHLPERGAGAIAQRHGLALTVACDRGNRLARRLGLAFRPLDDAPPSGGDPDWIGALTGLGTCELPMPAVILVERGGTVRFVDVSPDWLDRTEIDAVLESVRGDA